MAKLEKVKIEPYCKRVHHWGSFRPISIAVGRTGKQITTRACLYCGLTMDDYAKTRTPDRKR